MPKRKVPADEAEGGNDGPEDELENGVRLLLGSKEEVELGLTPM